MENEQGHRKMRVWQNADLIEKNVQRIIKKVPKFNFQLRSQIDRASNSVAANFVEGYYSGSTLEYIRFARYSKRSAGELIQHFQSCLTRGYITREEFSEIETLLWRTMYLIDQLIRALQNKTNNN